MGTRVLGAWREWGGVYLEYRRRVGASYVLAGYEVLVCGEGDKADGEPHESGEDEEEDISEWTSGAYLLFHA